MEFVEWIERGTEDLLVDREPHKLELEFLVSLEYVSGMNAPS